jgi:hypothetical protein
MKILEILKNIGIHIPKLREITAVKFSSLIHIDRSVHIEGSTVIIDPNGLSGKQKRGLKNVLPELLDESGAIVDESSVPTVDAVLSELHQIHEAVKKLTPIIPPADIPLLNACVFLRIRFDKNECVEGLKGQIMTVYGTRGGNFANLCSAGYLETWFLPMYNELVRSNPGDPSEAKARFIVIYNTILNELPWTEFVGFKVSAETVKKHILEKMTRNIENGVRYMNIHSLGEKNVDKIMGILPDIKSQIGAIPVRIDKDPTRIFVRLEIPAQISN